MLNKLAGTYVASPDVQLAAILEDSLPGKKPRPGHFWPSELCNPRQAFHDRIHGEGTPSAQLEQRFELGNQRHLRFATCSSLVPGCQASEAWLDGAWMDLPGIRGRIDLRHGDALVEFKTTPHDIQTVDDLWSHAPQYIAQLLIYAASWTKESREHHILLLRIVDGKELPLLAFTLNVKDLPRLRQIVEDVQTKLGDALKAKDPAALGQCAYFDNLCPHQAAKTCACAAETSKIAEWFKAGINVVRNDLLAKEFQLAWDTNPPRQALHPWDLAVPRKFLRLRVEGVEHFGGELAALASGKAKRTLTKACLDASLIADGESLSGLEKPTALMPTIGFRWLKIPKTKRMEKAHELCPAVLRLWDRNEEPTVSRLAWPLQQAAALAAYYGVNNGYVILLCPELSPKIRAFVVGLKDDKKGHARAVVIEALDSLRKACESGDHESLPKCPDFIQKTCDRDTCLCMPGAKLAVSKSATPVVPT